MKKSIWIFLLAVLLPSVVLGWLALRSVEEQKIILERRTAELRQTEADNVAAAARALIDEQRRAFADVVGKLIAVDDPKKIAATFTKSLAQAWSRKAVGFAIGADGRLLSPSVPAANGSPDVKKFLLENGAFLGGNIAATVYPVPVEELNRPEQMRSNAVKQRAAPAAKAEAYNQKQALTKAEIIEPAPSKDAAAPAQEKYQQADAIKLDEQETVRREASVRNVQPQQKFNEDERAQVSSLWSATTGFHSVWLRMRASLSRSPVNRRV